MVEIVKCKTLYRKVGHLARLWWWNFNDFSSYIFLCVKMASFEQNQRQFKESCSWVALFAYKEAALNEISYREWFHMLMNDEFVFENKKRSGWPKVYGDLEWRYYWRKIRAIRNKNLCEYKEWFNRQFKT